MGSLPVSATTFCSAKIRYLRPNWNRMLLPSFRKIWKTRVCLATFTGAFLVTDVEDPPLAGRILAASGVGRWSESVRLAIRYFRPYWKKIDDPSFKLIVKK
jgi:hypothetical protein